MLQKLKDENTLELSQLKIQQDEKNKALENKRKSILVMVFLCYSLGYKINKINDVNNVNISLRQKLGQLKELSTKLGIKSAQVQDETNKVDKRFIKYQMFLQRAGIDLI